MNPTPTTAISTAPAKLKRGSRKSRKTAPVITSKEALAAPAESNANAQSSSASSASLQGQPSSALLQGQLTVSPSGNEIELIFDTRRYRIRGLDTNHSPQQLRVNILAVRDELLHLDTLDLYQARSRSSFIKATASELFLDQQIVKRDVGQLLLQLERLQHQRFEQETAVAQAVEVAPDDRKAAMQLLTDPQLIERIVADLDAMGLVGEETNKLIGYLACVSRRLEQPLALLIQSGSAAGKTTLMDGLLSLMPPEDQVRYSAMTGQSLYYLGQQCLQHKILAIAEEEGVAQASYALKLLQSDGQLTIAAVGKHRGTGRQSTETYTVQGPVMMFLTTTAADPDPELQNRCLTLRVNESQEQTAEIHRRQRAKYQSQAGGLRREAGGLRLEAGSGVQQSASIDSASIDSASIDSASIGAASIGAASIVAASIGAASDETGKTVGEISSPVDPLLPSPLVGEGPGLRGSSTDAKPETESAELASTQLAATQTALTPAAATQSRSRTAIQHLHHNAQRLLQSLTVIMPWADQLTFRHDQTRMRRDHAKYLSLIAAIALLHQHQRKLVRLEDGTMAVEAGVADVELANKLISEVMGNSLDDLLPQTRQLLVLIDDWIAQQAIEQKYGRSLIRFSQRQLREAIGWSDFQTRYHLSRLIELEYVVVSRSDQGASKLYQLLYDGQGKQGERFVLGLANTEKFEV